MTRRRRKISFGEVFEVQTSKGLAYFQYTHEYSKPPNWGSLIRVLEGFYKKRPSQEEIETIVSKPHRFQTFLLLSNAIKGGEVNDLGTYPIPEFAIDFPIFKGSNQGKKTPPEDHIWWLWDGEKEWKVGKLSLEEQQKYPLKFLMGIEALAINIERGFSIHKGVELC